ncbi:hypothetical protein LINPERPRIM_LOCUS2025 [Linum perenne]
MTIIPLLFVDINNEPMYIWQDKLLALLIVRKNPNLAKNCRAYLLFYKEKKSLVDWHQLGESNIKLTWCLDLPCQTRLPIRQTLKKLRRSRSK